MNTLLSIAGKHLLARKRQSVVSLLGIVLGVAFFLAISSLMQGSQNDFIHRLIDNSPHITIVDEYRQPRVQPVEQTYHGGAVELRNVKPLTEIRGIRGYEQILAYLKQTPGLRASPVLAGQALVNFAGRDYGVTINGMIPQEVNDVSTIQDHMQQGSVEELIVNPDGLIIGSEMARKLALDLGDNITVAATTGQVRTFKILGIFHTGRADYDEKQTFASIKRVQALLNRPNRANNIIIKLPDPQSAFTVAAAIEREIGYKSISWQEASQDLLSSLTIRNVIMYLVVSAVLVVASFGIYNVISTVVLEKQRDIAILKSMGFSARDVKWVFIIQGMVLGLAGCGLGLPLGSLFMKLLSRIYLRPPGHTEAIPFPIDWGIMQFVIAGAFALFAAIFAAYLPARKAARVQPVDILRGGF